MDSALQSQYFILHQNMPWKCGVLERFQMSENWPLIKVVILQKGSQALLFFQGYLPQSALLGIIMHHNA